MKKILSKLALLGLVPLMLACAKEQYPEMTPESVPQAADLEVVIDVDQTTNYATFSVTNKGVTPVWIFGSELIDGKVSKKYAYTGNGLKLRFREAGKHSVEVKAYNAAGLSDGSKKVEFTMNNTYRDPFDETPFVKALSNGDSQNWVWNSTEAGHFGCGPLGDPLAWWSCGAGEKEGFLYDDVMTFTADGKYTFTPGDGKAYANKGSEYMTDSKTEEADYLFPVEAATSAYHFENSWNDAGVEEIYLVLAPGSVLSYVPHKSIVDEPRYLVLETAAGKMKKKLQLMASVFTLDNTDGISWYYEFVPEGSVAGAEDPLTGTGSKTWVLDNEAAGYMGCGPDAGNPTGWWSAGPHEKDAFGVTDDSITFTKDGKYTFNPGPDGLVYCNWETGYLPDGHNYSGDGSTDYDAPAELQNSTYTLGADANGEYIELPAGIFFTYIPRPEVLTTPTKLYIKELTADRLVLVPAFEGIIAWQLIFKPEGAVSGPVTYGENLWTGGEELETWFSPGDWSGGLDPQATYTGGVVSLTVPDGVGGAEWQGQVKLHSAIPIDPAKKYSFSAKITASAGAVATVKLTSNNDPDGIEFFYDNGVEVDDEVVVTKEPISMAVEAADETVMAVFDFGRFPVGTEITISEISLREVTGAVPEDPGTDPGTNPGTEPEEETIDETGINYWPTATIAPETWFSPADWSGGLTPQLIFPTEGNGFVIIVPEGTGGNEWQGQLKLKSDIPATGTFNFAARIASTKAGSVTVKMTSDKDPEGDNNYFYDNSVVVSPSKTVICQKKGVSMEAGEGDTVMIVFDFGRLPVGTVITVSEIGVRDPEAVAYGEENLFGEATLETWFSPGDWSGGLDPQASFEGGKVSLTCPDGIGGGEWQGQVKLHTNIAINASKKYQFSADVTSSADGVITSKVTYESDKEGELFYDPNIEVAAGEKTNVFKTGLSCAKEENMMVVFDFGRLPAGTTVTIENITVKESL